MNTVNTSQEQTINAPVFTNVWDALADTSETAANLRLRSEIKS